MTGSIPPETALEADIVVRHRGCAVSECLRDGAYAAQVSADREADILVMSGENEAQVETFVRHVFATQVRAPEIISRSSRGVIIRGRNPETGVVAAINASGCTILWPSLWREGLERYTVVSPTRERLDRLLQRLASFGEVTVERISEVGARTLTVSIPLATLTDGMTARQLHVIQMALERGYYETPRRTSTEAMAQSLGISRSTFEEHLRKAELRALRRFGSAVTSHPALADSVRRGAGRPPSRVRLGGS